MSSLFSGSSIEQCIEKAIKALNVEKGSLKYKVTKNERRFFKKNVEIEILENDKESCQKNEIGNDKKTPIESINNMYVSEKTLNNGAKVENGKIIIKDFEDKNTLITIEPCREVNVTINGEKCDFETPVTSNDKIQYEFIEQKIQRETKINISKNKLQAYLTIRYEFIDEFELVDTQYEKNLKLKVKKIGQKYPPKYTVNELKELLKNKGIRNGILEDKLKEICDNYNVEEILIAQGIPAEDDIQDEVKLYFKDRNESPKYDTKESKIDYRNRYLIYNVAAGDVLAELIPGSEGKDGIDVFGALIKRNAVKRLSLKAGQNCNLNNNKIISNIEGCPSLKGNTVVVNKVYKIEQVDLTSGNIDFVGNVEIDKNVLEGMNVTAGGELYIGNNVERAAVQALGQIVVGGNVLNSTVKSVDDNLEIKNYSNNIVEYRNYIEQLIDSADQLKENNLLGKSRYGEIIKLLIENKFRQVPVLSKKILNYNTSNGIKENKITSFITNKILGLGPLNIKDSQELVDFYDRLNEEFEEVESVEVNVADIYIGYAQGSTIESSGNVYITGKGQYTSTIQSLGDIEFTSDNSVCRGGRLIAGNEIKLKTVGSLAGVSTILKVPKNGKITAEIAYNNTIFCFGEKSVLLEVSSKKLVAYVDKEDEIVVEKFVL